MWQEDAEGTGRTRGNERSRPGPYVGGQQRWACRGLLRNRLCFKSTGRKVIIKRISKE